jgi:hypothetical protein
MAVKIVRLRCAPAATYRRISKKLQRVEVVMHIGKRLLILAVFFCVPWLCAGQSEKYKTAMEEEQLQSDISKKYLTSITSFGYISANRYHSGQDKRKGQRYDAWDIDEEMTSYLRSRFKNNFANFPYEFVAFFGWSKDPKIGHLQCKIWLHGDSYPIAYHVECKLGAGNKSSVLYDATLGITSKDRSDKDIKAALDRMVSKFSRIFFRARGEL